MRLCAEERGAGHAEHGSGHAEHRVRQFEFRDLHKPQRIPYRLLERLGGHGGGGEPSSPGAAYSAERYVYARVHMHDKAANTRVLHVTSEPLEGQEFDSLTLTLTRALITQTLTRTRTQTLTLTTEPGT